MEGVFGDNIRDAIKGIKGKRKLKKRYCEVPPIMLCKCNIGWGNASNEGIKSCFDEPMEENCRNIVEVEEQ